MGGIQGDSSTEPMRSPKESEDMEITFTVDYYKQKSDEELDVLVAEAAGLELRSLGGEGGWVDKDGALVHLQSAFHPTSNNNFALELFREVSADGNGLAINTADSMTKTPGILIGGFPFDGEKELPILFTEIEDMNDFGEFRKTLLRSFCIFYVLYKNSREE